MSQHTPGPWRTSKTHQYGYDIVTRWKDDGVRFKTGKRAGQYREEPRSIPVVQGILVGAIPNLADATLIAAAPDLLAECRATATMLRASPIADHPWAAERIAALDAAIVLATEGGA